MSDEKSSVTCMFFSLFVRCPFSLTIFKLFLFFCLVFLGFFALFFLVYFNQNFNYAVFECGFFFCLFCLRFTQLLEYTDISLAKFGTFSAIIPSNIFQICCLSAFHGCDEKILDFLLGLQDPEVRFICFNLLSIFVRITLKGTIKSKQKR